MAAGRRIEPKLPELRKDPIVGRWVIISTDRAKRPTDFARDSVRMKGGFCPFCYGNESKTPPEIQAYRPNQNGGAPPKRDTPGWTVRVVPNKFPALGIEGNLDRQAEGMFDKMNGVGAHEVIIETNDHNATLATLPPKKIEDLLWAFRDRVLAENEDFLTIAPYAPRFPFETWLLPKQHESSFENSSSRVFENLARAIRMLLNKANRVLDDPPYNLVIHSSPTQDSSNDHYHWHIEFVPKLTKVGGFEWGTGFYINPTPPEEAARFLREATVEEPATAAV